MSKRDGKAYQRWEAATWRPLLALALLFLVAYAVPILDPGAPTAVRRLSRAVEFLTWVLFAIDYVVRLGLAPSRGQFVRTHLVDLAAVALPMFRAMRVLRLVSIVTLLTKRDSTRVRATTTTANVGSFAVLLIIVSSLAVLDVERVAPRSQIDTIWDSLWWSVVTMTTVGYGDVVPVTPAGRVVGVLVMLTGIAVLGVVTANVSSWFVAGSQGPPEHPSTDDLQARIAELTEQLAIARSTGAHGAQPRPTDPPGPA